MATSPQAQYAIDALLKSGFKRSDFRVRTEFHTYRNKDTGQRFREYGDARVSLRSCARVAVSKAKTIARNGLGVDLVVMRPGRCLVFVTTEHIRSNTIHIYNSEHQLVKVVQV